MAGYVERKVHLVDDLVQGFQTRARCRCCAPMEPVSHERCPDRGQADEIDSGSDDEVIEDVGWCAPDVVRRARAGDREAFTSIVRIVQAPTLRLATVICGDSTEAY